MKKEFLKELLKINSFSGEERLITPVIIKELKKLGFSYHQDKEGNIFASRGKAPYPLLNAHMDIVDIMTFNSFYDHPINLHNSLIQQRLLVECMASYGIDCISCYNYHFKSCTEKDLCYLFDPIDEVVDVYEMAYDDYVNGCIYGDWVDSTDDSFEIVEEHGILKGKGSGKRVLGGDDKCGIFIALEIARLLPHQPLKILFTVKEEIGCVGIKEAVKRTEWFSDVLYSITIDRKGGNHILWSQLGVRSCSNTFAGQLAMRAIESGIAVEIMDGSVSDTIYLREIVPESVNVSAGYYDPHTEEEYIRLQDVAKIINWLSHFIINYEVTIPIYTPVLEYSIFNNKTSKKKNSKKKNSKKKSQKNLVS